ncbi:unnamed protein product [Brassica rapa]|uniref:Uncharacterized protein n=1 Tax=Brassica campestris TaxID=3711 RepID=A0A3P6B907_BRACM|nr:unnamed protein product [Brassica rapa]VDC92911.1 unnamed protein product [Brassica rapa]
MECSVHRSHHCFDILEGMSPQDDHFNSAFLPNANFHVPIQSLPPNSSTHNNNNRSHLNPTIYHNGVSKEGREEWSLTENLQGGHVCGQRSKSKSCSNRWNSS